VKSKTPYEPHHLMEVTITSINEPTLYDKNIRIKSVGFFEIEIERQNMVKKARESKIPGVGPAF
jgi:hypothetical protein